MSDTWYAVVRASPQPECGERVNVAIVFGTSDKRELVYVRGYPG